MCLSRFGVRSISGFRRAFNTNGATAFTSWVSSSSTDDTSCERAAASCCDRAGRPVAILVEHTLREQVGIRRNHGRQKRRQCRRVTLQFQFAFAHVCVELGRATHCLARVVDYEVEPVVCAQQVPAELLDRRRVSQVEAVDLEAVTPLGKVALLRVALGRVTRKSCRHDQPRAGAQQLDAGLVADLHAAAGQQRDAAPQVGRLGSLGEVEVGARRTHLVVEVVNFGEVLLAHVAVLWLVEYVETAAIAERGREHVRRGEDRLGSQLADPRLVFRRFVAGNALCLLAPLAGAEVLPSLLGVGIEEVARRANEPDTLFLRQRENRRRVSRQTFDERGELAQLVGRRLLAHSPSALQDAPSNLASSRWWTFRQTAACKRRTAARDPSRSPRHGCCHSRPCRDRSYPPRPLTRARPRTQWHRRERTRRRTGGQIDDASRHLVRNVRYGWADLTRRPNASSLSRPA